MATINSSMGGGGIRGKGDTVPATWGSRSAQTINNLFDRVFAELKRVGGVSTLPDATDEGSLIQYSESAGDWAVFDPPTTLKYLSFTGSALAWALVDLASGVTGTLPVANGGTNITSYTVGDMLYASGATTLAKLAAVPVGSVIRSNGAGVAPSWTGAGSIDQVLKITAGLAAFGALNLAASAAVGTSILGAVNGGTGQSTVTQGDLLYGSASNVWSKLAKDTNATRYLSNTGTSNNPAWAQVNLANGVTGVLPVANGGSGTATQLNIRKTADETVTDTSIQDDDHLTLSLDASSAYQFEFVLFFTLGGTTEGVKFDLNGTVGVSSLKAQIAIWNDNTDALAAFARVTAFASAVGATIGNSGDHYARISGTIETSTVGTFLLRFAQNATGASAGVTLQENSSLVLHKLNA